jgi:thiamine-phosphate pyrophosphorylase
MKPLSECKLYAFVDTAYLHGRPPELVAQQLCDGGADLIQLRAKTSSVEQIRRMAEAILPVTRKANVGLVINDYLSVAWELGTEFCHLGQEDFFDAGFTSTVQLVPKGARLGIGISTHAPDQATRAINAGADYIAIGPVYATGTKLTATPVTLHYVRWAAENVKIPWFAIGGINEQHLDEVLTAGATRICVVSAILNSDDITKTCAEFRKKL